MEPKSHLTDVPSEELENIEHGQKCPADEEFLESEDVF